MLLCLTCLWVNKKTEPSFDICLLSLLSSIIFIIWSLAYFSFLIINFPNSCLGADSYFFSNAFKGSKSSWPPLIDLWENLLCSAKVADFFPSSLIIIELEKSIYRQHMNSYSSCSFSLSSVSKFLLSSVSELLLFSD